MPDHRCPHLHAIGHWCRLGRNLRCPAEAGRVGCLFPDTPARPDPQQRFSERRAHQAQGGRALLAAQATNQPPLTERQRWLAQVHGLLNRPFAASELSWRTIARSRDASRALVRPWLGAISLRQRLNAILGRERWQWQHTPTNNQALATVELTVLGQVYTATAEDGEAALCLAAAQLGIGAYLADVIETWVDCEPNTGRLLTLPQLPAWALPPPEPTIIPEPPEGDAAEDATAA
jgi:hypothetical protein